MEFISNDLALLPPKMLPHLGLVAPKIHLMEKRLVELDLILQTLVC